MFSNTFAGIAPSSAPSYVAAQMAGGAFAVVIIKALYPMLTPAKAANAVVPHPDAAPRDEPVANPIHPANGAAPPAIESKENP
jgi:hypothetical protein